MRSSGVWLFITILLASCKHKLPLTVEKTMTQVITDKIIKQYGDCKNGYLVLQDTFLSDSIGRVYGIWQATGCGLQLFAQTADGTIFLLDEGVSLDSDFTRRNIYIHHCMYLRMLLPDYILWTGIVPNSTTSSWQQPWEDQSEFGNSIRDEFMNRNNENIQPKTSDHIFDLSRVHGRQLILSNGQVVACLREDNIDGIPEQYECQILDSNIHSSLQLCGGTPLAQPSEF